MSESLITKQALANTMKSMMQTKPFSKISVSSLCDACYMNRATFYYHFKDKYDLVNWIFDTEFNELNNIIQGNIHDENELWDSLTQLSKYLFENRKFYYEALQVDEQNCFYDHFHTQLANALLQVCFKTFSHNNTEENHQLLEFCARFYADAFANAVSRWLKDSNCISAEEFVFQLQGCISLTQQRLLTHNIEFQ